MTTHSYSVAPAHLITLLFNSVVADTALINPLFSFSHDTFLMLDEWDEEDEFDEDDYVFDDEDDKEDDEADAQDTEDDEEDWSQADKEW